MNDLKNRNYIIVGGTSGIGKATAYAIAKCNGNIILIGRDSIKGNLIIKDIRLNYPLSSIEFLQADISSLTEIKRISVDISNRYNSVHGIIHSAGVLKPSFQKTDDGYEEVFTVIYLNRFLLTLLLLKQLQEANGSIIMMGAPVPMNAVIDFNNLNAEKGYSLYKAAPQAQVCCRAFAQEFAKRHPQGPRINIVNAGLAKTEIGRYLPKAMQIVYKIMLSVAGITAEQSSQNVMSLLTDPRLSEVTCHFFEKPMDINARIPINMDSTMTERLWDTSLDLCKLTK